ncbi:MAG: CHY zinc finger protein [Tuberibacillus sp.]
MNIKGIHVEGIRVDPSTRCAHYHSEKDIIAIKFKCCETYYPCYECHEALADHEIMRWNTDEFNKKAILCGQCGTELTIEEYIQGDATCPYCQAHFNPGCRLHYHLYFERKE